MCLWSRRGWLHRNAQSNPEGDLPCCLYQWETEIPLSGRNVQQGRTCRHVRWVCLKKDQPAFHCLAQNACKSLHGLYFASLQLHIYLKGRILSFSSSFLQHTLKLKLHLFYLRMLVSCHTNSLLLQWSEKLLSAFSGSTIDLGQMAQMFLAIG